MNCQHWQLHLRDGIAFATLDVQNQGANTLSQAVLVELESLLDEVQEVLPTGLVFHSSKKGGFIAGADVNEFRHISDSSQATALARRGQAVLDRIAGLPFPTVAAIHGHCLGGGLELALACTYRVAREDDAAQGSASAAGAGSAGAAGTRLGLPEVKLGIHPGFAGTVRLPPLVGDFAALDLMLTGRTVSAKAARRLGLVDETVPERHLLRAAERLIREQPRPARAAWWRRVPRLRALRRPLANLFAKRVRAKANPDHYPAPMRVIELWRDHADAAAEAASLGELLSGRTSRSLVDVFLLGEALKRQGKNAKHRIENVHVIGAGVMGADIAIWAAFKGFRVTLADRSPEILAKAVKKAHDFYKKKLKDARAVQDTMDRLIPDLSGHGLTRADLVIEAIVEKLEAKQGLFADVERRTRPTALLASNTSSIPLEDIATVLKDPSRLVGLHFFNPVAQMQLVEIVRGAQSSDDALARARGFATALDRLPLDVKSSPGFLVNRILMPYLIEAVLLLEEGVAPEDIDRAATDFGMPMGPILLADTVGLDICLSVAEELSGPLRIRVPDALRQKVADGQLGKKSGRGFYEYDKRGRAKRPAGGVIADMPVTERMILRMLNEAVACLRENVVGDVDAVDAGMVYGTGFAPFLGGPMHYANMLGDIGIRASLDRLAQEYGERFKPDAGWVRPALFEHKLLSKS
jgi:3-hydroxyacyl-CoA dehydrogenase/enoyl-CoA hydratase/3-hydroxybutyryl-CoA epimerase